MIDPTDIHALFAAIVRHPNYLGGVIWLVQDVRDECECRGIDFDSVDLMKIDFSGWEGMAISDGWPVITDVLYEYEGEVE